MLDNIHVELFAVSALTLPSGSWTTQNVRSSFWRLYANRDDGACVMLGSGPYPLYAGHLYFIPAGVPFSCGNMADIRHFYAHFGVLGISGIIMREVFGRPICLGADTRWSSEIDALSGGLKPSGAFDLVLQCRVKALIYATLTAHLIGLPAAQLARCGTLTEALAPVLPAIEYIEDHPEEPLGNRLLAGLCSMSEAYFIRQFRALAGQSPGRYVLEHRITLAEQRLLFTAASIDQIAEGLGFGNRFYFSRMFTRQVGISPAAYRKAVRV